MLYRNGIAMIAINAGIASVRSSKSILVTEVSIRNPTTIRAGAVAKEGIARKINVISVPSISVTETGFLIRKHSDG